MFLNKKSLAKTILCIFFNLTPNIHTCAMCTHKNLHVQLTYSIKNVIVLLAIFLNTLLILQRCLFFFFLSPAAPRKLLQSLDVDTFSSRKSYILSVLCYHLFLKITNNYNCLISIKILIFQKKVLKLIIR